MIRILSVICLGSVLFLTIFAIIGDYQKYNEDPLAPAMQRSVSEVVQFSRDRFTGKSASSTNEMNFFPIIRVRRRREIEGVVQSGEATKRRENKRERDRRREKERERNPEKYVERKRTRKTEPLTRHARRPQHRRTRRPYKDAGGNRTRSRQRNHERRNLEKQYLVSNRTMELFNKKNTVEAYNSSSFIYPVNNVREVIFERRITPEKIGQILGEGRRTPSIQISDLLIPKTFLEVEARKNRAELEPGDFDEPVKKSETPLFLGKLKSIAMNVSRMNKAVRNLKEGKTGDQASAEATDFQESSYRYDYEDVFEDPSVSSWVNPPQSKEAGTGSEDQEYFLERALLSSVYMPIDDQTTLHQGLATLLSRLFQTLRNTTDEESQELLQDLDFDNSVQGDLCQKWLDCKEKLEEAFLGPLVLPACPCHYPSSIFYDDKIWDEVQQRHFRWRDVSGEAERLDVYKPGATYCIRSLLAQGGSSAAAQHCCYDNRRRLLTRGSGAGNPNLVSPEVSTLLHERIDVLPWRLCKGDFSRFNKVRPPNNDNHCKGNPDEDEYQRQIDTTKHY